MRYIGSSTWPPSAIVEAQWVAHDRKLERFRSEQPPYSILARAVEADVLPTCLKYGMAVIPWSPLQGGWLSGRYRKDAEIEGPASAARQRLADRYDLSLPANQSKLDAADQLGRLADEAGMTLVEMALAFVLNHPAVTAPIIGPRTMEHLEGQLTAADVTLSAGRPRPDRRDRAARGQPEPRRRGMDQPEPGARCPPALSEAQCGRLRASGVWRRAALADRAGR